MSNYCDICEFLQAPKNQFLTTKHWTAGILNDQAYFGRAIMSLREHKGSLSELSQNEWQEFEENVRKIEKAYMEAFNAVPLNWGCYMNNAFKADPPNPHVHWHIFPRYKVAPTLNGVTYDDSLYGSFYDDKAERIVSQEVVSEIAAKLVERLSD
jgi:diadenosine tetraphosphate (Ap4A) HIT family hydrolase